MIAIGCARTDANTVPKGTRDEQPSAPSVPSAESPPDETPSARRASSAPTLEVVGLAAGGSVCALLGDGAIRGGVADTHYDPKTWAPELGELPFQLPATPRAILGSGEQRPIEIVISHVELCARRADDSIRCWQSGRETSPADDVQGAKPRQFAAGGMFTCATLEDGGVLCWGPNSYGQLGDGTNQLRQKAARIKGLENVVEVAEGEHHACARLKSGVVTWVCTRLADGSAYCWHHTDPSEAKPIYHAPKLAFAGPVERLTGANSRVYAQRGSTIIMRHKARYRAEGDRAFLPRAGTGGRRRDVGGVLP